MLEVKESSQYRETKSLPVSAECLAVACPSSDSLPEKQVPEKQVIAQSQAADLLRLSYVFYFSILLDASILIYLNLFFHEGSETLSPFSLFIPWGISRLGRDLFIRRNGRNLTTQEINSLVLDNRRTWSFISYALRWLLALKYLNLEESLICTVVFILAYPVASILHTKMLRWGLQPIDDEDLLDRLNLKSDQKAILRINIKTPTTKAL